MPMISPFHLAFPVHDLAASTAFYEGLLGCSIGRTSDSWIDYDFWGHQVVAHLAPEELSETQRSGVDGKNVPVRHFGLVLPWDDWHQLAEKLKSAEVTFEIEPYIRFKGQVGEQATMFLLDPSGNALEFKSFKDPTQLFAS